MSRQKMRDNRTPMLKEQEVEHQWFVLDAEGKTLGRFASEIANVLRGKHRPDYTPHVDSGGGVIVVNADKIKVSGDKAVQKIYRHYTGFMGGLREIPYDVMLEKKPEEIIRRAVKGMVPRTRQGRSQMRRLRIFKGPEHRHVAQKPVEANI